MKNFFLSALALILSVAGFSQNSNLMVYNGMSVALIVESVVVTDYIGSGCGATTSTAVNQVVLPGGSIFVAPLVTGPSASCVDWSVVKVRTLNNSGGVGAVHPYYGPVYGPSAQWGTPVMNDYWYAIGVTPTQVVKFYP